MKLIIADDVKEMLESYRYHSFNLDDALHVIDEAPAVEMPTTIEQAIQFGMFHERMKQERRTK